MPAVRIEPDTSVPELIGRLTDDSKRLVSDELRLAKLETGESLRQAVRGAILLALAFGIGVIALVGLTVLLTVLIGRVAIGATWAGALITAGLEILVGAWLVFSGINTLKQTDFTLGESRAELRDTKDWIARQPIR
jgi:uncharacterized membrane protein YqjE